MLAVFKCWNFLADRERRARERRLGGGGPPPRILLPIGLSFHTFQSMSYVGAAAQRAGDLGVFALYVMFYPQLVAGPIERPQNLLAQFDEPHRFDYDRVTSGLKLMAWGFVKKMVVADRLALLVNAVYGAPERANGVALLASTVLFAYQIYCDFSGYSDIARGSAEVMGFRLMVNFDRPYTARSLAEFWRRWHISLSTWFRDYVYFPSGAIDAAAPRGPQRVRRVPHQRPLARRELDVRGVGALHGVALAVESSHRRREAPRLAAAGISDDSSALGLLRQRDVRLRLPDGSSSGRPPSTRRSWCSARSRSASATSLGRRARRGDAPALTEGAGIGRLAPRSRSCPSSDSVDAGCRRAPAPAARSPRGRAPSAGAYALALAVLLVFSQTSLASAFIYFQF